MDCGTVQTGQRFVAEVLGNLDCQAQTVGSFGYQALANPASAASIALTGLLTIFVAFYGFRLMSGRMVAGHDLVTDFIKLGIVLTLATSWPAWRTAGYDLVVNGPDEIASALAASSGLPAPADMTARLQQADDGMVLLTIYGTGRMSGGVNRSDTIGDSFRGIALADQEGFANGRIGFLVGTIGSLGLVRLAAGLLLAVTPLIAGFLLFAGARGVFYGWLRALSTTAFASVALRMAHGIEVALLQPWVNDAIAQREQKILTPSAPTELVALSYSFALISFGLIALAIKVVFFSDFSISQWLDQAARGADWRPAMRPAAALAGDAQAPSRAFLVAQSVAQAQQREERLVSRSRTLERMGSAGAAGASGTMASRGMQPAVARAERGSRDESRHRSRGTTAGQKRDRK